MGSLAWQSLVVGSAKALLPSVDYGTTAPSHCSPPFQIHGKVQVLTAQIVHFVLFSFRPLVLTPIEKLL